MGWFELNATLDFRFGPAPAEVDLLARDLKLAIEVDGYYHFLDDDAEGRDVFYRLLSRATAQPAPTSGRILLLEGVSGSGKTHLMRAFRNTAHRNESGYRGYLQMTSSTGCYARYLLHKLLDALDQPYRLRKDRMRPFPWARNRAWLAARPPWLPKI